MFDAAEETTEVLPGAICSDVLKDHQFHQYSQAAYGTRTRPFMKIQDGCDFNCAFCVLPRVRGRARSRRLGDIIDEAKQLAGRGHKEIVLAGVSIGSYGFDDFTIVDVAEHIAKTAGVSTTAGRRKVCVSPLRATPSASRPSSTCRRSVS